MTNTTLDAVDRYVRHELPPHLACQVRSFGRVQWPGVNTSTRVWNYTPEPDPSVHFVITDGELLVAHASVRVRPVFHGGSTYRVAGVSAVLCYPDYRGRGIGTRIARAATEHVDGSGADCGMLFCGERVSSMYKRLGWEHVSTARITYGTPARLKSDNLIMMRFLSDAGRGARGAFEGEVVHVGGQTW